MRGSDVQMEVLPADVNLDGHRSALICFSSWNMAFAQCLSLSLVFLLCLPSSHTVAFSSGTATSGNGDFGDWSAFNQASPCASASSGELFSSTAQQPALELFSGSQPAPGQPSAASNSMDLFDLMGPSQTTMTSSQSMNFSMMSSSSMGVSLPMSRSQVCCYCYSLLMTFSSLIRALKMNAFLSWHALDPVTQMEQHFVKNVSIVS